MDTIPLDILRQIVQYSNLDLESVLNLRLVNKAVGSRVQQVLWHNLVVKYDYVSDILPSATHGLDQFHIQIDRHNITALMACDNGACEPYICQFLPNVRRLQIGGFTPPLDAKTRETQPILNKKFVDQLFDRLISTVVPKCAVNLAELAVVGNQYEYIPDDSLIYKLIDKLDVTWGFDLPQTPLTSDFIAYALQNDKLTSARIVVMSEFLNEDECWLEDENEMQLPQRLEHLTVQADKPGKVVLQEDLETCHHLFGQCQLKSLTLSGLKLNTTLFKAIPPTLSELTIAKCDIKGSETAKVEVDHLVLDTEQQLSQAVELVAEAVERLNIEAVNTHEIS